MEEINCRKIAEEIIERLKSRPRPEKTMVAVLAGENPASLSFLKQKQKIAGQLGINFKIYGFPEKINGNDLKKEIEKISSLKEVGGIIIQLPLPSHLNRDLILSAVPAKKDVDVLAGHNQVLPPPIGVVKEILSNQKLSLKPLKVAVIGQGFLIGKPITDWIKDKCQKLYVLDEGDDFNILKQADLIISGVGKAGLFNIEDLNENATIIDFGYGIDENGKIKGDFNPSQLSNFPANQSSISYTPTPGGTGPILIAKLFENFYELNN